MRFSTSLPILAFVSHTACGSSTWPVLNTANVSATIDDETLTLQFADENITLPRYSDLEEGSFVVGIDDPEGFVTFGRVIAASGTENTIAVLDVSWDENGTATATPSFARLQKVDPSTLPTEEVSYTGTYFGTVVSEDEPLVAIQRGDLIANINFSSAEFDAEILDIKTVQDVALTVDPDFLAFLQAFGIVSEDAAVTLEPDNYYSLVLSGALDENGTLSGSVIYGPEYAAPNEPPIIPETSELGSFSALVGGENGSELVGQVEIGSSIGVFAAGH